jgi:hypothetical protein
MTTLDAIAEQMRPEPLPDLPRLATFDTFLNYRRLMDALETAMDETKRIPESNAVGAVDDRLKTILKQSEAITRYAGRLLEANR